MSDKENSLQRLVDALSAQSQRDRANYHLTLGKAIDILAKTDPNRPVKVISDGNHSLGPVDSYRGYYVDLAFTPININHAGAVLKNLREALGAMFEGYKGGEYVMTEKTPLWIAEYGDASEIAVMDFVVTPDCVQVITKNLRYA
jgi:hypothetical protein